MEVDFEEVERAAEAMRGWLRSPNIVVVGPRTYGDGDHRIQVRVKKKKKLHEMDRRDIPIPPVVQRRVPGPGGKSTVVEIRTDVVECGNLRLFALDRLVRPAPGGVRIGVSDPAGWARGTLGVNLRWNGRFRLLTCNHVIAKNGNVGATVYQPASGCCWWPLTAVTDFVPVQTANEDAVNPPVNRYDFAWCDIDLRRGATIIAESHWQPAGYRAPKPIKKKKEEQEQVAWIGQETGTVQEATIKSRSDTMKMEFLPGQWATFGGVIALSGGEAVPGDSGSAVIATSDRMVVGLLHAGDDAGEIYATRIPWY